METKTYKADSTLETLKLVQSELGAEAIVVSMREIPAGPLWNPWKKSTVEIVAAKPEETPKQSAVLRPAQNQTGVEFVEEVPEIEWDIPEKKMSVEMPPPLKMKLSPLPKGGASGSVPVAAPVIRTAAVVPMNDRYLPDSLKKIQQQLVQQGVDSTLVDGLLDVAQETLSPMTLGDVEACKRSIIQLMAAELRVQKGAGNFISSNVVCVVGASGSGKTSALAKLALFIKQSLHKSVTWVCADTVRLGAIAEARAYTDALGIELKLVYTPQDLKEILQAQPTSDMLLVDTSGYNPCSESQMMELGALLSEMPGRCTFLATPVTMKEADLLQLSASLGMFNLDGLILTKLDETRTFGAAYNFARKNQVPLGYFTTGRDTANHLETANPEGLVSALFGNDWNK